ncbi:hypothetical protein LWI29_031154 [Acer saccharum]|uniref:Pumilio homolog 23 n=1 Tax=Acer saccharum TaxID=4024 RepID=A0AA39SRZ1_ACESA|nr:hypothetical protein LWI29_031154 [Acer saccharum]
MLLVPNPKDNKFCPEAFTISYRTSGLKNFSSSSRSSRRRSPLAVVRRSLTVWLFYARCLAAACCWATTGWIFWFEGEKVLFAGCALLPLVRKGLGRKAKKESFGFDGDNSNKYLSGGGIDGTMKGRKSWQHHNASEPQTSVVRKQVDPELVKYFSEIANLFESNEVELEERSVLCRSALEETRGKEFELATDYIISHTLQMLLEGCDVDHLCGFLQGCAEVFPAIAMDRSGSHVAESALKSLAMHLQDEQAYSVVEETLTMICKVIVGNPVDLMCNCYGSHVLRSLLCVCKGVPLDSSGFHRAKPSIILAERLNLNAPRSDRNDTPYSHPAFPDLLKSLISEMLRCSKNDIKMLQTDQYSSLVLQTALKLLVGHDQELLKIIPTLLGCSKENVREGNLIEMTVVGDVLELMKETAFSHLMEVILEVAPEGLYNEMFTKVFKNSLFKLSTHHCANFVIQALISHARNQDQMVLIWEELGAKFRELFEMGRAGVIAALIAANQRLHTHEHKCCQALSAAVCSTNESPRCIVPRTLFLESYFSCGGDRSNWNWPNGVKMHVIGSLILQAVFRFQSEHIQPFITSITSMEAHHVFETAKDAGGARVIEAFLSSNASGKQKHRLVVKLRGHFGELSMHSSGSFTVEKCFTAGSLSLREAIASELSAVQIELSKTKQGFLLRKLDIDGFSARPDQWKLRQSSKQSTYKEFYAAFGSSETNSSKKDTFLADSSKPASNSNNIKTMREEIDHCLGSAAPSMSLSGSKRRSEKEEQRSEKYTKQEMGDDVSKGKKKKSKKKKDQVFSEDAGASSKGAENATKQFLSTDKEVKKRHSKDKPSKSSKKLKV